jgi:hypothetical protein
MDQAEQRRVDFRNEVRAVVAKHVPQLNDAMPDSVCSEIETLIWDLTNLCYAGGTEEF